MPAPQALKPLHEFAVRKVNGHFIMLAFMPMTVYIFGLEKAEGPVTSPGSKVVGANA